MKSGNEELIYTTLLGMKPDLSGPVSSKKVDTQTFENRSSIDQEDDSSSSDEGSEQESKESSFKDSARPKNETVEEKRVL